MLNDIPFNDTYNIIYGLIIILIIIGIVYKTYNIYAETLQKKFIFFASMFLISGFFELLHIFMFLNNPYIDFLNIFLVRLYQSIGLLGIIFIKKNPPNEKIIPRNYILYFISFIAILGIENLMLHYHLTQEFFPNLLNGVTTFIFIIPLSAFILIKLLGQKPIFNNFNLGLLFLLIGSIYIINPYQHITFYQHSIRLCQILGNLLIFLNLDAIKETFQEYRLRLKLILLPNLYMILFFILFILFSNLLFNLNFLNQIYFSFIFFYILYFVMQSVFIFNTTSPITKITHNLSEFDPNKEPQLLEINDSDEIGILVEHINKVAEIQWSYTREIQQKQMQIQDLMNSRDSFIAALSHDLKSPIFAEQKFIESILLERKNIKVSDFIEYLEDMYKINDEVLRIVNNLLTAYYLDSQKLELDCENTDINLLIENAQNTLKHLAKDENIKLSLDLIPKIPMVYADKDMLSRVITNLISNAIKHSHKSGEIKISTMQIEENIQISIQDYGKGIPKEEKINIFQKYPSSKRTVGTGLGLYISKQIIDAHNGKIWFESEVDKGTVFYFTLPVKQ
jgi:signal transduction histidine kinase